jgi:dipeptidyl aminopeptidase/acylaminoacyl peptidase
LAGALLLMIIVGAAAVFFATRGWPAQTDADTFTPPDFIEAPIEGSKVVELCDGQSPPQICVYDAHTGQRLLLTDNLEFETIGARNWSPNGEHIVFCAGSDSRHTGKPDSRLYIISADGSDLRQITNSDTNDMLPVWSPDGEWIAFHRDGALWLVHPDGTAAHALFEQEQATVVTIGWSPDGQRIAFMLRTENASFSLYEVWMINRDGTVAQAVYSFKQPLVGQSLTWDQEGEHIACHCVFDGGENKNLLFYADGVSGEPLRIDMLPYLWFPNFWPQWARQSRR